MQLFLPDWIVTHTSWKSDETFVTLKRILTLHKKTFFAQVAQSVACCFLQPIRPNSFFVHMVSLVDTAKRALVTLLKSLAAIYSVTVERD